MFERVYCINLDRRTDRWDRFLDQIRRLDWPLPAPIHLSAVDGHATGHPTYWKQGAGAWGCLQSHNRILEECIRDDVESVLILEDDVIFKDDFVDRLKTFIEHIPVEWDQLYLGGQHLRDPVAINEHVFRCFNVNRTHAHAVHRCFMKRMYRWITDATEYIKNPGFHVDHQLGQLHETGTVRVFAPTHWLCGQADGESDISGRKNPTLFWEVWREVPKSTMTVILDLHCGYGSAVANLMKTMPIHFGNQLRGYKHEVEDIGLSEICESIFPFPRQTRTRQPDDVTGELHDWCHLILQEAAVHNKMGAACYPTTCLMHEEFASSWQNLAIIDVKTPLDYAVSQLQRRSKEENNWLRAKKQAAKDLQLALFHGKKKWRRGDHPTLSVCPTELEDKDKLATKIAGFLQVSQ